MGISTSGESKELRRNGCSGRGRNRHQKTASETPRRQPPPTPPPPRHAVSRRIVFVSKFRGAVDSSRGGSIMHDFCHRVGKNRTSVARARASSEIRVSRGVTTRCRVSGSFLEINYLCITINYDTAERAFLQSARNGRAAATATRENLQNTPRLFYLPTPL